MNYARCVANIFKIWNYEYSLSKCKYKNQILIKKIFKYYNYKLYIIYIYIIIYKIINFLNYIIELY